MQRAGYLILFIMLISVLGTTAAQIGGETEKKFTLVIDPGHGGNDPGAMYQGIKEKDIVLKIALILGQNINREMPDVKVVYTRNTDVFIPLHKRTEKAIENKADVFISLHANACATPSVAGTETFVLGMHRTAENLEVAKKENAVILIEEDYSTRYEGFDPNLSESYIMFDLVQEEYFEQSVSAAALVQNHFKNSANRVDRGVKQAGFLVLRETSAPSILIEAGYLSNKKEAQYLNSENGQQEIAKAIQQAVKEFKDDYDRKNGYNKPVSAEQITSTAKTSSTQPTKTKEVKSQLTSSSPQPEIKQPGKASEVPLTTTVRQAPSNDDLYYAVQIAATSKKIDTKSFNFKGLKEVYSIEWNGIYKYCYGKEQDFGKILARKTEAGKLYADAFIIAFWRGKPISLDEAKKIQNQ